MEIMQTDHNNIMKRIASLVNNLILYNHLLSSSTKDVGYFRFPSPLEVLRKRGAKNQNNGVLF